MNAKTYTFVKYIATISSVFLLTAPFLVFIQWWKEIFSTNSLSLTVNTILIVIGFISMAIYLGLRIVLKNKSEYVQTPKDKKYLLISVSTYGVSVILATIYVIIGLVINNKSGAMISFYVLYPLVFATVVAGAIFESMSRIGEQIFLYQKEYETTQVEQRAKIQKLVEEGTKPKTDAEILLEKAKSKEGKKPVKKIVSPEVIKTNKKNPFMDEKLNEELKKDKKLDNWLNEDKKNKK